MENYYKEELFIINAEMQFTEETMDKIRCGLVFPPK